MFSVIDLSVCPFTGMVPCDHCSWCMGPHYTGHGISLYRTPAGDKLVAITGHLFKLVHLRTSLTRTDIWWLLKRVWLAQASGTILRIYAFIFCQDKGTHTKRLVSCFSCGKYAQLHHKWKFILFLFNWHPLANKNMVTGSIQSDYK